MFASIRREDYRPPRFDVPSVDLHVELNETATRVNARLCLERREKGPLVLDGEHLDLVSVAIDGRPLAPDEYALSKTGLTIADVPDRFVLETVVLINPKANTVLEGLYLSEGLFCTQCEAEGFRRITYFPDRPDVLSRYRTRIVASKQDCPVLLSNGNLVEEGTLEDGRHYALWDDPFPKPSYLFALVAGKLDWLEDTFVTASGRRVRLRLYSDPADIGKCRHALQSLKKAMRWDEDVYGLEYDLDQFNIVAVRDFNMGAMENKSLNVFNSKLLLATPETATDEDHARVEGVIAHEYFHNWTGNRITCRDWFQLSLKEGLTVFRDQQFSEDMGSAAVQRIDTVRFLRIHQFAEDDGPLAHPVRPDSYIEINNFYSFTVYEKGAEVVRMLHTILGRDAFRRGMDLYVARHDGQAVTCDDFIQAMEDASGIDLAQFRLWYSQAGTPRLKVAFAHDPEKRTYRLDFAQEIPPTPGQEKKAPMHIPIRMGLIDGAGRPLPLKLTACEANAPTERVLNITEARQSVTFYDIAEDPTPSLLRGFSAPVRMEINPRRARLAHLMRADEDLFNRWEAKQRLVLDVLLERLHNPDAAFDPLLEDSFSAILAAPGPDKALTAEALMLPEEEFIAQHVAVIDVDAVHAARCNLRRHLARVLRTAWEWTYESNRSNEAYRFTAEAAGRRRLKNLALSYLMGMPDTVAIGLAMAQFRTADNMTDEEAALVALANVDCPEREDALEAFYRKWRHNPLVMDKWFAVQARADHPETFARVQELLHHEAYDDSNPNRVRALIGAFTGNRKWFHTPGGEGYAFLVSQVVDIDKRNPRLAARLVGAFEPWRRFDPHRRELMHDAIRTLAKTSGLSRDVAEKVGKFLVGA